MSDEKQYFTPSTHSSLQNMKSDNTGMFCDHSRKGSSIPRISLNLSV